MTLPSGRIVVILIAFMLICFGVAASHISRVQEKWGAPGKIEKIGDKTIIYYCFKKGKASGLAVGGSNVAVKGGDYTAGRLVYEFTTDPTGKIIKERKYWKQPKLE